MTEQVKHPAKVIVSAVGRKRLACLVTILLCAYLLCLILYVRQSRPDVHQLGCCQDESAFRVRVRVTQLDTQRGTAHLHLEFERKADASKLDDRTGYVAVIQAGTREIEHKMPSSRTLPHLELDLSICEGEIMQYPFDHHRIHFEIAVYRTQPSHTQPLRETVPICLIVDTKLHGFALETLEEGEGSDAKDGFESVDLTLQRTNIVKICVFAIITAMLCVTAMVVWMTLAVVFRDYKIEMNMVTFMASALFVFPAIRNMMPGVPPLGSLPDFLATFWVEGITAVCLVAVVWKWTLKPPASP